MRAGGVELRSGLVDDLGDRGRGGERAAVRPVGRHRVERVGDGDHARAQRDRVAEQSPGIAVAVDALVMVQHARHDVFHRRDRAQDRRTDAGVHLDHLAFVCVEPGRLEQHRVRNRDLAQIVQQRTAVDQLDLARRQLQLDGDRASVDRDPLGVAGGVRIAQIQRPRHHPEGVDERRLRFAAAALQLARGPGRQRDDREEDQCDAAAGRADHHPALAIAADRHLSARQVDRDDVLTGSVAGGERCVHGARHAVVDGDRLLPGDRTPDRTTLRCGVRREDGRAAVVVQRDPGDVAEDVGLAHGAAQLALRDRSAFEPVGQRREDGGDARDGIACLVGFDALPVQRFQHERQGHRRDDRADEGDQRKAREERQPRQARDHVTRRTPTDRTVRPVPARAARRAWSRRPGSSRRSRPDRGS